MLSNTFFAISAGILSVVGLFPYVWSIINGQTKPSGASWWTWALLGFTTVLSSWFAGASWQVLLLPTWLCLVYLVVAILSIKRGDNKWDLLNKLCVGGACLGIVFWLLTGQPLVALVISIIADIFASIPNFRHVWLHPKQENRLGWTLGWIASIFEVLAIHTWSIAESGWAIYFLCNMSVTLFLILRPMLTKVTSPKF